MPDSEKKPYFCDDKTSPYILIVDNNHSDICLLESILRSHGFISQSLADPTTVFVHCRTAPSEIVLLDISMPEMNDFQVCGQLKKDPVLCNIPVLFLTAMSDVADKIRGFQAGMQPCVLACSPLNDDKKFIRKDGSVSIGLDTVSVMALFV